MLKLFSRRSRRQLLIISLVFILVASPAIYYLAFLHEAGTDHFQNWSGTIRYASSPLVRLSCSVVNPVQEWEKELYAKLRSGVIDRGQVAEQLAIRYELSIAERDLNAWIARMMIYTNFLHFFGAWLYAPDSPGWARLLWERYAEVIISLGFAFLTLLLAQRISPRRVGKHLPFLTIFIFATAIRIYLLVSSSWARAPPSDRDLALGWALSSGYGLYSPTFYYSPPAYALLMWLVYSLSMGSAFCIGMIPVLCSLTVIVFSYLAAWHLIGRDAALVTAGLLSFTPMLPWGLGLNYLETPYLAFVTVSAYFMILYEETEKRWHLALAGLTASMAILMKQLAVSFVAVLFAYILIRHRNLRKSISIFMASFLLPALCIFIFPLSALVSQAVLYSLHVPPISWELRVDRLVEVLVQDKLLTVTGFVGSGYLAFLGISKKRSLLLFPMLVLMSIVFPVFVMQYIDPHHIVIAPFLAVGSGFLLSRLGDLFKSRHLMMSLRSAQIAKSLGLAWLILGSMAFYALPAIGNPMTSEPYKDQATRLILEYTEVGDFVIGPNYAIMQTNRRPVPELLWDSCVDRMNIVTPDLPAICESYRIKLLILDDFSNKYGRYVDYLWSHYRLVRTMIADGQDPVYIFALVRTA